MLLLPRGWFGDGLRNNLIDACSLPPSPMRRLQAANIADLNLALRCMRAAEAAAVATGATVVAAPVSLPSWHVACLPATQLELPSSPSCRLMSCSNALHEIVHACVFVPYVPFVT